MAVETELMTVEEVARVLRLSTKRTYAIVARWHFKVLVGSGRKPQVRVRRRDFEQWLASGGDACSSFVELQNPLSGMSTGVGATAPRTESQQVFEMTAHRRASRVPRSGLSKTQLLEHFPGYNPARYPAFSPGSKPTSESASAAMPSSRSSPTKRRG